MQQHLCLLTFLKIIKNLHRNQFPQNAHLNLVLLKVGIYSFFNKLFLTYKILSLNLLTVLAQSDDTNFKKSGFNSQRLISSFETTKSVFSFNAKAVQTAIASKYTLEVKKLELVSFLNQF
ncbi:MAG: hypothetical protein LBO09_07155 [Candidatus Peribacteria bacterium]|jgi:hypothetical protein|nr:hypothetical protein [Candidatus Peribacteria bacterium]